MKGKLSEHPMVTIIYTREIRELHGKPATHTIHVYWCIYLHENHKEIN